MTFPNFLIIGAQRSGTTSLYYYLKQHPEIFLSLLKEPHFFTYLNQPDLARKENFKMRIVFDMIEYERLFSGVKNEKAVGEASPSYLYFPSAATRIKEYLPSVRLIAILRNPVDRAFSGYLHAIRNGKENVMDFSSAIDLESYRIEKGMSHIFHYINKGFYAKQLKNYFNLFDSSQIKICLFDDLITQPVSLLKDLFYFLQIDPSFKPDITQIHNESGITKKRWIGKLLFNLRKVDGFDRMIRRVIPAEKLKSVQSRLYSKPTLSLEVRSKLINLYREDILELQGLIKRDLSCWLR